ncbi:MAG: 30S ribosomal protein S6 [Chloroflexi bacterium]|nr:30S ribosomal protein S6 [Chloroflexota bacterium]
MRRYELMLVLRPDVPDDRVQAVLDRATRTITDDGGQMIKVSPWGRRRLAYPIGQYREGSYYIVVFEAPASTVAELERGFNITEDVMRHLVTRVERPTSARRAATTADDADAEELVPPADDEPELDDEVIDESETEAAPAAIE